MKFSFSKTAIIIFSLLVLFSGPVTCQQQVNISQQLKQIEWGEISRARDALIELKKEHPKDPSVVYLDAMLTADGKDALEKYMAVADKHPGSYYADAALYRIYSYYYALGLYSNAKNYMERLKSTYPGSPYIRQAENKSAAQTLSEDDKLLKPETEKKVLSPASTVKTPEKQPARFTIQAGAFLNLANAQKLMHSIEAEGYKSEINKKEVAGTTLNVVYAGKFSTEDEARSALLLINDRFKLNGRVIKIE